MHIVGCFMRDLFFVKAQNIVDNVDEVGDGRLCLEIGGNVRVARGWEDHEGVGKCDPSLASHPVRILGGVGVDRHAVCESLEIVAVDEIETSSDDEARGGGREVVPHSSQMNCESIEDGVKLWKVMEEVVLEDRIWRSILAMRRFVINVDHEPGEQSSETGQCRMSYQLLDATCS